MKYTCVLCRLYTAIAIFTFLVSLNLLVQVHNVPCPLNWFCTFGSYLMKALVSYVGRFDHKCLFFMIKVGNVNTVVLELQCYHINSVNSMWVIPERWCHKIFRFSLQSVWPTPANESTHPQTDWPGIRVMIVLPGHGGSQPNKACSQTGATWGPLARLGMSSMPIWARPCHTYTPQLMWLLRMPCWERTIRPEKWVDCASSEGIVCGPSEQLAPVPLSLFLFSLRLTLSLWICTF